MRAILLVASIGVAAFSSAQTSNSSHNQSSPAGGGAAMTLINTAISKASSAMKAGKTVTLTVDNRSVAYSGKLVGGLLYVPIRFFTETGERVTWNPEDMRATLRSEGTQARTLDFDARRTYADNKPGASMKPVYENGRVWVPLATGLVAFGHLAQWVPGSTRLNISTNRG